MAQGNDQEKTEAATPFTLQEARRKGVVAKSPEANSVVVVAVGLLVAASFSTWAVQRLMALSRTLLANAGTAVFTRDSALVFLGRVAREAMYVLSPLFVLLVLGACLSNLLQTGFVFSTHPLKPDFSRINPVEGFKRLFSKRTLVEGIKAVLKLTAFGLVAYFSLRGMLVEMPTLYGRSPKTYPAVFEHYGNRVLLALLLCLVVIALLDLLYTRWEFLQKMRMSRRELKDELRRHDGDPMIRKRLRELQRELRRRASSIGKVKDADVLVTNPEHFAVALKYRRGVVPAPEVVAKGAGSTAQKMRELAFQYHVPIMPNPRLARALFREVPVGHQVPEVHYATVARVLKWAYRLKKQKKSKEGGG